MLSWPRGPIARLSGFFEAMSSPADDDRRVTEAPASKSLQELMLRWQQTLASAGMRGALVTSCLSDVVPGRSAAAFSRGERMGRLSLTIGWGALVSMAMASGGGAQAMIPIPKPTSRLVAPSPAHLPPSGMCRIWLENVPAGQQPAPTDCASAIRNRPQNARVIFSDDDRKAKPTKADKRKPDAAKGDSTKPAVPE